jgi:hypothetical protein
MKVGYSDISPEGIFGIIDNTATTYQKYLKYTLRSLDTGFKFKLLTPGRKFNLKKVKLKTDHTPFSIGTPVPYVEDNIPTSTSIHQTPATLDIPTVPIEVDYQNLDIPVPQSVLEECDNVVEISEDLLSLIASTTDAKTKEVSRLMLTSTSTTILSYQHAVNYVRAVMADAFNIDFSADLSVELAVKEIAKFEILSYFVQNLTIEPSHKELLLSKFIQELVPKLVNRMVTADTVKQNQAKILEAVIASRGKPQQKDETRVHNPNLED